MQPRLYLRPGVTLKHLTPDTLNGFGKAQAIFFKYNQPFAVTCTSGGSNDTGPLCPDQRIFGVEKPESATPLIHQECLVTLGHGWKIEKKRTYWRFEFNPEPLEGTPL